MNPRTIPKPAFGSWSSAGRAARASEAGENPQPSKGATAWCRDAATDWSPDATTVIAPYGARSPAHRPPVLAQQPDVVDHRWVFVIGMIALPVAIFLFTDTRFRAVACTLWPIPSNLSEAQPFGGHDTDACGALDVTHCAPTAPKGGNLSVPAST